MGTTSAIITISSGGVGGAGAFDHLPSLAVKRPPISISTAPSRTPKVAQLHHPFSSQKHIAGLTLMPLL
jgi:hypothetical protein